jgi:dipeptidyl aminopeptidase/acylaminoacyl peptidase
VADKSATFFLIYPMKKISLFLTLGVMCFNQLISIAQDADAYQLPPKEIADLLLAKPTPFVRIDSKAEYLLLLGRNSYPSVEELGQPEMKIAGLRLNPLNFSPSRQSPISSITLQTIKSGAPIAIAGLPKNLAAGAIAWNPSETKIAFTQTEVNRVDLYVIDIATKKATRVNADPVNQVLGNAFTWVDDQTILYKATTHDAAGAPKRPITPKGPTIQQNIGKAAPRPTFQDLIKSPYDESLFAYYAESQLVLYKNGVNKKVGKPELTNSFQLSPDRQYVMNRTLTKPFSYAVPAYGFTSTVSVKNLEGKVIKELAKLPSAESAPAGNDNVQNVPRGFEWRDDEPASIVYAMPLDSGFIKKQVEFHDAVYSLAAPFTQVAKELFKTKTRFAGVTWGDKNLALVSEVLRGKQTFKVSRYTPQTGTMEVLYERNLTDAYRNPGSPVQTKNAFGRDVIQLTDGGTKILMNNPVGSSDKGDLPFIAKFDLITKKNEIIWRAKEGSFEMVEEVIDADKLQVLTRKESKTDVPNYFIKNLLNPAQDKSLTQFENPYPNLVGITKEKIKYKRADGVDLTGDLYLPKGYNKEKDGPLPVLIWAYPREFNSAADAAQIRGSKDRFTTLSWASPIYYATQGYAILDNAEMPIVSTDASKKPNDNFVEQLKLNASAAIDHLVQLGVGDRKRMAVGGHSYGAFMTANLLAHTDLFKAGIARSGAYNRTLTPFGFQNEDRTYWQAPQLYFEMSPFSYADKIKEPILLVHGEQDDNTGTYPINSERLYAALKGNGGTTRFVYLPYEAHSYRGRENVLHLLWEQFQWLEKYLK